MRNISNRKLWYQAVGRPTDDNTGLPIMSLEPGEMVSYDCTMHVYKSLPGFPSVSPGALVYAINRTFFEWCHEPTMLRHPCKAQEISLFIRLPQRLSEGGVTIATHICNIDRLFTCPPPM
jgi:hypothetical protein